jgi:hypothetical protein
MTNRDVLVSETGHDHPHYKKPHQRLLKALGFGDERYRKKPKDRRIAHESATRFDAHRGVIKESHGGYEFVERGLSLELGFFFLATLYPPRNTL